MYITSYHITSIGMWTHSPPLTCHHLFPHHHLLLFFLIFHLPISCYSSSGGQSPVIVLWPACGRCPPSAAAALGSPSDYDYDHGDDRGDDHGDDHADDHADDHDGDGDDRDHDDVATLCPD